MIQFTERELKQIISLCIDMPKILEVTMGSIPGLSIAGAKLDMLQIQLKAETMLNELKAPQKETPPPQQVKHRDDCNNDKCWGECFKGLKIQDLKKAKIQQQ